MQILLLQFNVKAEPKENIEKVVDLVGEKTGVTVVLPELFTTGFRYDLIDSLGGSHVEILKELPAGNTYIGSIPRFIDGNKYNSFFVHDDNGTIFPYDKVHLFPLMEEPDHFDSGDKPGMFDVEGGKAGCMVCFDLRFPELARKYFFEKVKVIFVPTQWPMARREHLVALTKARAIENQCYMVMCNAVGEIGGVDFAGSSCIVDPWGQIVAQASLDNDESLTAILNFDEVDAVRERIPVDKSPFFS